MSGRPGRDWLGMTRRDFDVDAPEQEALFDAEPGQAAAPDDGCGTGDLLAELGDDA